MTETGSEPPGWESLDADLRYLVTHSPELFAVSDLDGTPILLSPGWQHVLGWSSQELTAFAPADLLHPDDLAPLSQVFTRLQQGAHSAEIECRFRHRDGGWRNILWSIVRDPTRERICAIGHDVTAYYTAQAELRRSESLLDQIGRLSQIGGYEFDFATNEITWSNTLREILGLPADAPASLEAFNRLVHPDDLSAFTTHWASLDSITAAGRPYEYRIVRPNREIRNVAATFRVLRDASGAPARVVGAIQDITERRRLEAELLQAQKMEVTGRLAGGIAHDFNNLLTVIGGYSDMVASKLDPRDPLQRDVQEIAGATARAAGLTRQLLAFSRKQVLQPRPTDLNVVIRDAERMLSRLIGARTAIRLSLAPDLPPVLVDPGQIVQVIVNLAVNARDAMPDGGTLTFSTKLAGAAVELAVADTGHGMDRDLVSRIFEPFFTTKEAGKGTGLGLSMVYGIVRQSGGSISVESEPGSGTTFHITLPTTSASAGASSAPVPASTESPAAAAQTVLLVEDDDAIRNLIKGVLARAGFLVLAAAEGADALRVAESHEGEIHALVSDLSLPGEIDGAELASRVRALRPAISTLFISGYSSHPKAGDTPILQKPFDPAQLVEHLRRTLAAGQ